MKDRPFFKSGFIVAALFLAVMNCPTPIQSAPSKNESFGGVGLQVVPLVSGELVVLRVLEGSPALEADIRPGDLVFQVDGKSLVGMEFATVVKDYLWGEPGTRIRLKLLRPGEPGEKTVTLRRIAMDPEVPATPGVELLRPGSGSGQE